MPEPAYQESGQLWKKTYVRQPDLAGELYVPTFCLLPASCPPPAMVLLPDDSGVSPHREGAYAAYFASRGMTCLVVDPFSPLGLSQCLDNPRVLSLREMMSAACAAYALLIVRRRITTVGICGIGRGGLAALHLGLSRIPGFPHFTGRFSFIVALSPAAYIQLRQPVPTGAPMLIITGSRDELAHPEQAASYAERLKASSPDLSVTSSHLPGAFHAWDTLATSRLLPDAVQLPENIYYLEEDGRYTDETGIHTWLPGDIVEFMASHVHYGAHVGGSPQAFTAVCQAIDAFILRHHYGDEKTAGNSDLLLLNRLDHRDDLLLRMGRCENLQELFALVSTTFGNLPETALFRIWLCEAPGDACRACHSAMLCSSRTKCLHLIASAGHSLNSDREWNSTTGSNFEHFPYGIRKVGVIAATGEPFYVRDVSPDMPWVADPKWIEQEKIHTLLGQPLIHMKEVIGVVILFSRGTYGNHLMDGLRIIADHMAIKIAQARAFEELTRFKRQLEIENSYLQQFVNSSQILPGLIGESPAIARLKEQILHVAPTNAIVLIVGESGTGKELVAEEIHKQSCVSGGPLVKVNCPTIPRELFESEFFGHIRGAFTGAATDHIGFFEAAENGSLFLDEIGEIPLTQQSKLLRALQENEYRRVGEEKTHSFHARIIAATNRDLRAMVGHGSFREDLYYRLNVFPIVIPPLRERRQDIPLLAFSFLEHFARQLNRPGLHFAPGQMDSLLAYDWPGNIRELRNTIYRASILSRGSAVFVNLHDTLASYGSDFQGDTASPVAGAAGTEAGDMPLTPTGSGLTVQSQSPDRSEGHPQSRRGPRPEEPSAFSGTIPTGSGARPAQKPTPNSTSDEARILDMTAMREFEKQNMLRALRRSKGKIFGSDGAAGLLGLRPTTLLARLAKLGIDRNKLV